MAKNNDEEIRQRNKDSAQSAALFWIGLANDRISNLNLQLLTLAGILLPLTASLLALPIKIAILIKILLFTTWIFLLLSVTFGLIEIAIDALYFAELAHDSSRRNRIWSRMDESLSVSNKEVVELGTTSQASTHIPVISQAVFISLALFTLVIMGTILLFS